jgi:hypothetical protein
MATFFVCPGTARLKGAPTITEKICPECGRAIEIFSIDTHVVCKCGFIAYNDEQTCIRWCKHARECVGSEVYDKFKKAEEMKDERKRLLVSDA